MTALRVLLLTAALACRIVTIAKSGGPTRSQLRNTVPEHEQESRAERRHNTLLATLLTDKWNAEVCTVIEHQVTRSYTILFIL